MVFKNLCAFELWMKLASTLEGLIFSYLSTHPQGTLILRHEHINFLNIHHIPTPTFSCIQIPNHVDK